MRDTPVPLHPVLKGMLDKIAGLPAMQTLPVETIRAGDLARYSAVPRPEVGRVEERTVPGPRGDIRIRVYRPEGDGDRPVVVFFHGSGFVICSLDTHDGMCRQICRGAQAVVVSVDYALAPENKFPAGPDDSLAATRWVAANAASLGGDPSRLALAGDSAGGTMAIVTALRLRDEGGPRPAAMLLMYPVTDFPSVDTPSYAERGSGFGLTADGMRWFWDHYLRGPEDAGNPHASPLRAESLAGLPPAYIVTAGYDILRDEGEALADRLERENIRVTRRRYEDMNHGFMSWIGIVDRSGEAMEAACAWLRAELTAVSSSRARP